MDAWPILGTSLIVLGVACYVLYRAESLYRASRVHALKEDTLRTVESLSRNSETIRATAVRSLLKDWAPHIGEESVQPEPVPSGQEEVIPEPRTGLKVTASF